MLERVFVKCSIFHMIGAHHQDNFSGLKFFFSFLLLPLHKFVVFLYLLFSNSSMVAFSQFCNFNLTSTRNPMISRNISDLFSWKKKFYFVYIIPIALFHFTYLNLQISSVMRYFLYLNMWQPWFCPFWQCDNFPQGSHFIAGDASVIAECVIMLNVNL